MPSSPLRIEYTSAALTGDDYRQKIDAAQSFCAARDIVFGIQIHNQSLMSLIERLAATGAPLSYHAPNGCEYFMNLANRDFSYAQQSIRRTAEIINRLGGDTAVFHGFLMTDVPILAFNTERSYEECKQPGFRSELSRPGTTLCCDFFGTDEYLQRYERVKQRLVQLQNDSSAITWCIENDYPAYGAGLLLAEQAVGLDTPLCLDISHLWIACLLFGRDYLQEAEMMAQTGRIKCVHFHANPTSPDAVMTDYRDGHQPLSEANAMNLPRLTAMLREHGVRHWIVEAGGADVEDLEILADWLT